MQHEDMPRATIASHVLDYLAEQRRVIAADWRFHLVYVRIARSQGFAIPDAARVSRLIASLQEGRDIDRKSVV